MKRIKNKLILSVFMLLMTAVTLTSVTYAWFSNNKNAWVDEFEIDIENTDGLLISVDGEKYYSDIHKEEITKAILAKSLGKDINAITQEDIDKNKMALAPVSTADLVSFTTIDGASEIKDGYYQSHTADKTSYIEFDLYFKAESSKGEADKKFDISFVHTGDELKTPFFTAEDSTVKLSNELTTTTGLYGPDAEQKEITVNPRDAMRLGIVHNDAQTKTLYEPYLGLGSYAIAGETEDVYNPEKNAMLTYFNNTHRAKLLPLQSGEGYKDTKKSFDDEISFGRILPNAGNTDYEPIKITVFIWLEGYDADYFAGVSTNKIKIYLSFTMREVI